jgi:outer membrane protein OmpA-like peptidoglycan-associated protein
MRKQIIVLAVGALLAQTGWTRDKSENPKAHPGKEESIGVGSGAAIGALAGGPIGLIVGAAMGGWLGDRFHHERVARVESEQQASQAQQQASEANAHAESLEQRLSGTEQQLASSQAELKSERSAHRDDIERAVALDVHFRTEDSTIDAGDEQRLAELASFVAPLDGTVIRLDGHADVRGTQKYNDAAVDYARRIGARRARARGHAGRANRRDGAGLGGRGGHRSRRRRHGARPARGGHGRRSRRREPRRGRDALVPAPPAARAAVRGRGPPQMEARWPPAMPFLDRARVAQPGSNQRREQRQ